MFLSALSPVTMQPTLLEVPFLKSPIAAPIYMNFFWSWAFNFAAILLLGTLVPFLAPFFAFWAAAVFEVESCFLATAAFLESFLAGRLALRFFETFLPIKSDLIKSLV